MCMCDVSDICSWEMMVIGCGVGVECLFFQDDNVFALSCVWICMYLQLCVLCDLLCISQFLLIC